MNKKKIHKRKKTLSTADKILLSIIGLLFVLVIILAIVAIAKGTSYKNTKQIDMTIPIVPGNKDSSFTVGISDLEKNGKAEYLFQIKNYNKKNVNKKEMKYTIQFAKTEGLKIAVYKEEETTDILENGKKLVVEGQLKAKNKEEQLYRLVVTATDKTSKDENIKINITSK